MTTYSVLPIQYPGSTSTSLVSGDGSGDFAGSEDGEGFVDHQGNFAPVATDSFVTAMSATGTVVGFYFNNSTAKEQAFADTKTNQFSDISLPANTFSAAEGISPNGNDVVGFYFDGSNDIGFLQKGSQVFKIASSGSDIVASGVNDSDEVVGSVGNSAFIFTPQSGISQFTAFGATNTSALAVNDAGVVLGQYNNTRSFIRDANGNITPIDYPGATETHALSINSSGEVAGYYIDQGGNAHGFVYDPRNTASPYTPIDGPNGTNGTFIQTITDTGQLIGDTVDNNGNGHGLVETPFSTVSLTSAGASGPDDFSATFTGVAQYGSGLGIANQTVTFTDNGQTLATTATTDANGNYSAKLTLPALGTNSIVANITDPDGLAAKSTAVSYETHAPTVSLTSAGATGPDNSSETLTGVAKYGSGNGIANQTVTFTDNGQNIGAAKTDANGNYSTAVTLPFIGTNSVVANIVDPDGLAASSSPVSYDLFKAVRDLDATSQEIEQLYYTLLNRPADAASLAADDQALARHPASLPKLASSLIGSHEYRTLHGHQTNAQFVEALYEGAFGRAVDAGALTTDTRALAHGSSRQALAANLSQSAEAVAHLGVNPVA